MKKIYIKFFILSALIFLFTFTALHTATPIFADAIDNAQNDAYNETTVQNEILSQEDDDTTSDQSNSNIDFDIDNNSDPTTSKMPVAKIVVYGGGKVTIKPDIAYVTVGVESKNSDLQIAIKDNNDIVLAIIEHLNSKNITENDIKTKYYSVYQSHNYSTSEKFQEYHVINTIEYKTTNLDDLGETISQLTKIGANRVEDIQFDCSNISDCYKEALKLALEDAKSKASGFTDKDLSIEKIAEECIYTSMPYRSVEMFSQNSNTINSGNIEVEAKIVVVFI